MSGQSAGSWAREEFGRAALGDSRRERRLVAMAAAAAKSPHGCVSRVFRDAAERQGAYDFLENANIRSEAIAEPMFRAAARRITGQHALVVVDGSSLTLTDKLRTKGLGAI